VNDFLQPDRVVLGVPSARAEKVMRAVYAPLVERARTRLVVMDNASAELAKYAANAMLATRISFINEIAELCEATGADVTRVRQAIAYDPRIGAHFLDAGLGYGGCCFPKDVHALIHAARALSKPLEIVSAADRVNTAQRQRLVAKVQAHFGQSLSGISIALWGLAFKPHTDDVRDAPALTLARELTALGARVVAFDPHARAAARAELGDLISFAPDTYSSLQGRDALVIATEWPEFVGADLGRVKTLLRRPVIFDGRNLWDPERMEALGFHYYSVGRRTTTPGAAATQPFQAATWGGEP
jgi:UDPglucose 6-dehydrogenase